MQFGSAVEVEVQRKLPEKTRAAASLGEPIFRSGPGAMTHQSGSNELHSSGQIILPQQLARAGAHSYVVEGVLIEELSMAALTSRGELDLAPAGQHAVAILDIHLQPAGQGQSKRRRTSFVRSPAAGRGRRGDDDGGDQEDGGEEEGGGDEED